MSGRIMRDRILPDKAGRGMPATASQVNELLRGVITRIIGGKGIRVHQVSDKVVIESRATGGPGGDTIPRWVAWIEPEEGS
jgi:fructose-1-phosphate kinase PfkB-like protein